MFWWKIYDFSPFYTPQSRKLKHSQRGFPATYSMMLVQKKLESLCYQLVKTASSSEHLLPPTKEEVNAFAGVRLFVCLSVC